MSGTFLRVPTMLRAMFRLVEGPHSLRIYSGAAPSSAPSLRDELLASSSRPELLLRFLAEMDRKLDAILTEMQRETLHEDFPLHGRVTELGGQGARLEYAGELSDGSHIELLLLLEEYPVRVVSVLASVKEDGAATALTRQGCRVFELSFVSLEQDDRESIIRFVFSEERKRIRRDKGEHGPR